MTAAFLPSHPAMAIDATGDIASDPYDCLSVSRQLLTRFTPGSASLPSVSRHCNRCERRSSRHLTSGRDRCRRCERLHCTLPGKGTEEGDG